MRQIYFGGVGGPTKPIPTFLVTKYLLLGEHLFQMKSAIT